MDDYRLFRETMSDSKFREDAKNNGLEPFYFGIFPKGDVRMKEDAVAASDKDDAEEAIMEEYPDCKISYIESAEEYDQPNPLSDRGLEGPWKNIGGAPGGIHEEKELKDAMKNIKTLEDLNNLQNKINEMFDTRRRVLNLVSEAKELGSKSFGYLKESFENLSPRLFKTDEGKVVMRKYTTAIKENKSLSSLHKLYENIRKAHSGIDFDYFVGTICETNWNVRPKELSEGMQKLAGIVAEGYILVGEGAGKYLGTENDRLDGAIEFIAENKVGQKNIVKYSEAVKVIREAVEKNGNISDSFKKETDLDKTIEDLVAKYSKDEYTDEEEKDMLTNQIARSGDEETVFIKKKTECVDSLDEAIKKYSDGSHDEELNTLKKIHEQVSAKTYNPETIGPDICNFVEMSKLFE